MTTFIIDIDGTLCEYKRRMEVAGPEPERGTPQHWEWLDKIQLPEDLIKDNPIPGMKELVWAISTFCALKHGLMEHREVVYLTARNENLRQATNDWLQIHGFPELNLFMRPEHETVENHELKRSIIRAFRGTKVIIDDDPSGKLADVCLQEGWTFLKPITSR